MARQEAKFRQIREHFKVEQILVKQSCDFLRELKDPTSLVHRFFQTHYNGVYPGPDPKMRQLRKSLKGGRVCATFVIFLLFLINGACRWIYLSLRQLSHGKVIIKWLFMISTHYIGGETKAFTLRTSWLSFFQ